MLFKKCLSNILIMESVTAITNFCDLEILFNVYDKRIFSNVIFKLSDQSADLE